MDLSFLELPESDSNEIRPQEYKWKYFRHREDHPGMPGWVFIAPGWPIEAYNYIKRGATELDQYGEFYLTKNVEQKWSASLEPFRQILARGGGAEFPVDQVVEFGWHRKPPYGVKGDPKELFPQLRGVEIHDAQCRQCHRWFKDEESRDKHYEFMHRSVAESRAIGTAVAEAMAKFQGNGVSPELMELVKMLAESNARLMAERPMDTGITVTQEGRPKRTLSPAQLENLKKARQAKKNKQTPAAEEAAS